jgi:hypothetical protein
MVLSRAGRIRDSVREAFAETAITAYVCRIQNQRANIAMAIVLHELDVFRRFDADDNDESLSLKSKD